MYKGLTTWRERKGYYYLWKESKSYRKHPRVESLLLSILGGKKKKKNLPLSDDLQDFPVLTEARFLNINEIVGKPVSKLSLGTPSSLKINDT